MWLFWHFCGFIQQKLKTSGHTKQREQREYWVLSQFLDNFQSVTQFRTRVFCDGHSGSENCWQIRRSHFSFFSWNFPDFYVKNATFRTSAGLIVRQDFRPLKCIPVFSIETATDNARAESPSKVQYNFGTLKNILKGIFLIVSSHCGLCNATRTVRFLSGSSQKVKWSEVQFSEKPQNWHKKEYCFQVRQAFKSFFVTKYFFWGGFSLLGSFYYSKKISWAKWNELPKERPVISPSNSLECSSRLYFPNIVDSSSRASKEVSRGM